MVGCACMHACMHACVRARACECGWVDGCARARARACARACVCECACKLLQVSVLYICAQFRDTDIYTMYLLKMWTYEITTNSRSHVLVFFARWPRVYLDGMPRKLVLVLAIISGTEPTFFISIF